MSGCQVEITEAGTFGVVIYYLDVLNLAFALLSIAYLLIVEIIIISKDTVDKICFKALRGNGCVCLKNITFQ